VSRGAKRCNRCRDVIGTSRRNLCDPCWYEVPLELRRAWFEATRTVLGSRRDAPVATKIEVARRITEWVQANPIQLERGEPLWKRPR